MRRSAIGQVSSPPTPRAPSSTPCARRSGGSGIGSGLRGREVDCPRLSGWEGDAAYSYSGLTLRPAPWTPGVTAVRRRIEAATGDAFNSVLANLYRDGGDRMGWHADDEPELGRSPVIASASFGAPRRFLLRPKRGGASVCILLEPGSLLVMRGATQRHWTHSVPPTRRTVGPRINLTFRRILAESKPFPA